MKGRIYITVGTTTAEPEDPQFKFEYESYNFQPFTTSTYVGELRVVGVGGQDAPGDVVFTWGEPKLSGGRGQGHLGYKAKAICGTRPRPSRVQDKALCGKRSQPFELVA